jgi:soluble lytic murein transglycosylase-like protein
MTGLEGAAKLYALTRSLFALVGIAVVASVAWPASRDSLLTHVATLAEAGELEPLKIAPVAVAVEPAEPMRAVALAESEPPLEERALARFIARRYRVADEAASLFVRTAFRSGREHGIDPLLILAVTAIESRFNPVAESSMGAMGLMQVIPRFHPEKLADHGGEQALLDPEINIQVGTRILREYLGRFRELEPALQKYAGALDEPTAQYTGKVLAEKARLQQAIGRTRREA